MTAIDFPNSPSVNDTFTASGRTWTWTGSVWASDATDITAALAEKASLTGAETLTNKTLTSPEETWTTSATAATGTVNFDCSTQGVLHYTSNASADWTLNFRGNSSTSLNSILANGQAITLSFLVAQGSTAYKPTAFQIDGSAVTPKWSGGTAPSAGNASSTDVYSFTISKTASATYNVFAAGPIKYS